MGVFENREKRNKEVFLPRAQRGAKQETHGEDDQKSIFEAAIVPRGRRDGLSMSFIDGFFPTGLIPVCFLLVPLPFLAMVCGCCVLDDRRIAPPVRLAGGTAHPQESMNRYSQVPADRHILKNTQHTRD